ncbi:unnamed protein product [Vitrella brassicaformis CCMP3155]|uniref:Uncharacterized protein n=1 Tax=Vitrella brassicaformis (strain CCMP3155) TaxID=1169540 RepID=A0A0G4FSH4_VITBC|nr:unnamed protein product [Vitrella brassicaformis CCMP3155]|eukprot:CEM17609.1 unnamed protein product [Vitrella brassicaformis CCMP3155]
MDGTDSAAWPVRYDTSERSGAVIVADDAFFLGSLYPIPEDSPPLRMSEAFQHLHLLLQGRQQEIRIRGGWVQDRQHLSPVPLANVAILDHHRHSWPKTELPRSALIYRRRSATAGCPLPQPGQLRLHRLKLSSTNSEVSSCLTVRGESSPSAPPPSATATGCAAADARPGASLPDCPLVVGGDGEGESWPSWSPSSSNTSPSLSSLRLRLSVPLEVDLSSPSDSPAAALSVETRDGWTAAHLPPQVYVVFVAVVPVVDGMKQQQQMGHVMHVMEQQQHEQQQLIHVMMRGGMEQQH